MASEPSLVDELWESLVAVVIAAAVGLWWLVRRPWLLGAALIATGVVARGRLDGRRCGARCGSGRAGCAASVLAGTVYPLGVWALATGADRIAGIAAIGVG